MRTSIPALLVGSALVSACAAGSGLPTPGPTNPLARTPTQQYSPAFVDRPDEILLAATGSLSGNQAAALGELAMRWTDDGRSGPIVITNGAGPASGTAAAAAEALASFGVPPSAIVNQLATSSGPEPVRVGFTRVAAVVPDCAERWGELTRTRNNEAHSNFGCAVASNIAVQAANPRDLLQPRGSTPADGGRRADVIEKYRKGVATGSQRGADERGVVSGAIQ